MRVRVRRRVRMLTLCAGMAVAPLIGSCRTPAHGATKPPILTPDQVDPQYRDDWAALTKAREADPGGDDVLSTADRILARSPPPPLRLAAVHAKVEHAYAQGRDADAVALADEALRAAATLAGTPAAIAVRTARVRALVRGGDPQTARQALRALPADALTPRDRAGLTAVALDRDGAVGEAVVAYARWRAAVGNDDPEAAYATARLRALAGQVDRQRLVALAKTMGPGPAGSCVAALGGGPPVSDPPWAAACSGPPNQIGILLPRSGPLSALADLQLAAAAAAVEVLTKGKAHPPTVVWADSGSSPQTARSGADALLAQGAAVIVGPVGAKNIRAAAKHVGARADVVVPAEETAGVIGVAPSLEGRLGALLRHAAKGGASTIVVLAPDNRYGKRAAKAISSRSSKYGLNVAKIQMYPTDTTSFAAAVRPVLREVARGAAVVIPDRVSRVEMVVRQLAREGHPPARSDRTGATVLSTAEGADARTLGPGHDALAGVLVSPAAAEGPATRAFAARYQAREGEPPGDQALLVFFALRRALDPAAARPRARVLQVLEGRLVPPS